MKASFLLRNTKNLQKSHLIFSHKNERSGFGRSASWQRVKSAIYVVNIPWEVVIPVYKTKKENRKALSLWPNQKDRCPMGPK